MALLQWHYLLIQLGTAPALGDTAVMTVESQIRERLTLALEPSRIDVLNESHLHAGHRGSPGTGNSHFRLLIVSPKFAGLPRVARHRLVNQALGNLIGKPIHALAMETLAPGERQRSH